MNRNQRNQNRETAEALRKLIGEQPMNEGTRQAIDEMDYREMLEKVRYAPVGSPWFAGETGDYFMAVMKRKRV